MKIKGQPANPENCNENGACVCVCVCVSYVYQFYKAENLFISFLITFTTTVN